MARKSKVGDFEPPFIPATWKRDFGWEEIVTEERCEGCEWPEVCTDDKTCWIENRRRRRLYEDKRWPRPTPRVR